MHHGSLLDRYLTSLGSGRARAPRAMTAAGMRTWWRVALLLACFAPCRGMPQASSVDNVHSLMEPALKVPKPPRLKNPVAPGLALLTPGKALMVLPAALVALGVAAPDLLARLLLQVICFFGSLIEPFDPLLPQKGLLRTLVREQQTLGAEAAEAMARAAAADASGWRRPSRRRTARRGRR